MNLLRSELLELLICPACQASAKLDIDIGEMDGDDIVSGMMTCSNCRAEYPIENHVPRFVRPNEDYCENFGFQWLKWRTLQIDRLSGHNISRQRFLADSRWAPDWFPGKLILDAGCGAGRFTDIVAELGARVIAVDISSAIEACRETTAVHAERPNVGVDCIQASLFNLPLREGVFDGVYCMGVIQHTPEPGLLMQSLPRFLKPGGRLAYNFYEEGLWRRLQLIKYGLRLVSPFLPIGATLTLSKILVSIFFPITRRLNSIPKIRLLNHFIPIAAIHDPQLTKEQQRTWTLLDTFDWYGARYEKRQKHDAVAKILESAGLGKVSSKAGLAWGMKPKDV